MWNPAEDAAGLEFLFGAILNVKEQNKLIRIEQKVFRKLKNRLAADFKNQKRTSSANNPCYHEFWGEETISSLKPMLLLFQFFYLQHHDILKKSTVALHLDQRNNGNLIWWHLLQLHQAWSLSNLVLPLQWFRAFFLGNFYIWEIFE